MSFYKITIEEYFKRKLGNLKVNQEFVLSYQYNIYNWKVFLYRNKITMLELMKDRSRREKKEKMKTC